MYFVAYLVYSCLVSLSFSSASLVTLSQGRLPAALSLFQSVTFQVDGDVLAVSGPPKSM